MPIYSNSSLSTFENCPLSYQLRYVQKIETGVESVEAYMGSRVHDALEWLHRLEMNDESIEPDGLLDHYHRVWSEKLHENIRIVRKQNTIEHYRKIGQNCLERYYKRHSPFEGPSITLELEHKLEFKLKGGYKMTGFIDRLSRSKDGQIEIHDYKTSRYIPSQERLDKDRQLGLYQIGIQKEDPHIRDVDLIWHYLYHDKRMYSKRTESQLEQLENQVLTLILRIENALVENCFPAVQSRLCPWCSYNSICQTYLG